jgi:poly(3-hydroxybutyrate) depolymerase
MNAIRNRAVHCTLAALLLALSANANAKDKVQRQTINYNGQPRTYFCLIPAADPNTPLPVVVLLHGSGNNGQQMTSAWSDLASRDEFIIVAPNSFHSEMWDSDADPPAFLHAIVADAAAHHPIDPHRVYLFGHSAGAVYALGIALIDSEYFAAAGGHAGALTPQNAALFTYARRKMPIALWVGAHDDRVSVDAVNATRDAFAAHGFSVRVTVLPFAGHAYDGQVADKVTRAAWDFFRTLQLP